MKAYRRRRENSDQCREHEGGVGGESSEQGEDKKVWETKLRRRQEWKVDDKWQAKKTGLMI